MTLAPGIRLGTYEILAPLGAGGMGEVYRAKDTKLGREVAIKVLPESFSEDIDRVHRFEQEAKALAALNHPNILTVHDLGAYGGSPYLVMELLEGETLRDGLSAGALPTGKALEIAVQITRGLAAAHGKGIVHRDLKPENVFLTKDGVKVLDFGLAKQAPALLRGPQSGLATQDFRHATVEGSFIGTVGYMSPEQVRGEAMDARSDLFALGLLLYEMLTGRQAFKGATTPDTLSAILTAKPPGMETLGRESGTGLAVVLARCLAKRREDRFSSAQDLAFALQALAHPSSPGPELESTEKSIVVLPFENLSPDPDNAYFADGLTEELITDLSKVQALRVISRTSAMHFKSTTKPLPEIAQALKVRYVLEGSVRKAGHNLRITAQLIEAATDTHLWAEKYSGTFDDVFDMQEKVSRAIVEALKVQLSPEEVRALAVRPLPDPVAYEAWLRASQALNEWNLDALVRAGKHIDNAMALVGEHPLLLAARSQIHFQALNLDMGQDERLDQAAVLAERALTLDPDLAQGHLALAFIGMLQSDFPKSLGHARRAYRLDPRDANICGWGSFFLALAGRCDEGSVLCEEALRLDPLNPNWPLCKALLFWCRGEFEAALPSMETAWEMGSEVPMFPYWRALLLAYAGRIDEAPAIMDSFAWEPEVDSWAFLGHLFRAALDRDGERFDALFTTDKKAAFCRDCQSTYHLATFLSWLGRKEDAFRWLGRSLELSFGASELVARDPLLVPLHDDPRWQPLLEQARRNRSKLAGIE